MQHVSFETTIKDGYIRLPQKYSRLNNTRVVVEILSQDQAEEPERIKKMEEFIKISRGMLKGKGIPEDITIKEIQEMRLKEKYDRLYNFD